jgi:diguanylate cyclase (GGDEF)-like protein/putative nucleotidyltransferase with HDIG domain
MSLQREHRKLIHNHVVATHLACTFVLLAAVWKYLNLAATDAHPTFLFYFFLLSLPFLAEVLLLSNTDESRIENKGVAFFYILFPALAAIIILFFPEGRVPYARTVLLLPVLVTGYLKGRTAAYIMSAVCWLALMIHDVLHGIPAVQALTDTNFVLMAIIIFGAWFSGTISELESHYRRRLTSMVYTDDLTGLKNERFLYERLFSLADETQKAFQPLSIIFIDVDNFKYYNDVYGHQEGDQLLVSLGEVIAKSVPEAALTARYGGEEFVVVLPGFEAESAAEIAESIREQAEQLGLPKGHPDGPAVTISCGVASMPRHAKNYKELVRNAEQALYEAKVLDKNRVVIYCSVFDDMAEDERELVNSVQTLIAVINVKDRYTYGHSVRVLKYASEFASWLGLEGDELRFLRYAAFLHDIGKIEIDRYLLNTPGRLTPEEINTFRQHPHWGSEIVGAIPSLEPAARIIRHHHENYDGSGYPDQLKGEEIPLAARIIRIVDSYDAMTTDRPYHGAMSDADAIEQLVENAGTAFDPELVQLFKTKKSTMRSFT